VSRLTFDRVAQRTVSQWAGHKGDVTVEIEGDGLLIRHASSGRNVHVGPVTRFDLNRTEDGFLAGVMMPALDTLKQRIEGK
jgi:hypothetical protein